MSFVRVRIAAATIVSVAALGLLGAQASWADSGATNGGATSITSNSVTLNGTVNATDPDSAWAFQYGTTTAYGHLTPIKLISAGVYAVSAQVTGLSPGTTYHFRLILSQGSYPTKASYSADAAFTTHSAGGGGGGGGGGSAKKYGHASLLGHVLTVNGGAVKLTFKCAGVKGAPCKGTASLTTRNKGKTVGCGHGGFSTTSGKRATARIALSGACKALLAKSSSHKLVARLKVTFSSHQIPLGTPIALIF